MSVLRPRSFTLRRLPRTKNRRRCVCRRWCARKNVDVHSQLPQGPGRDDRGVAPRRPRLGRVTPGQGDGRHPTVQSRQSDATGQRAGVALHAGADRGVVQACPVRERRAIVTGQARTDDQEQTAAVPRACVTIGSWRSTTEASPARAAPLKASSKDALPSVRAISPATVAKEASCPGSRARPRLEGDGLRTGAETNTAVRAGCPTEGFGQETSFANPGAWLGPRPHHRIDRSPPGTSAPTPVRPTASRLPNSAVRSCS
ncbi:hypothetical protein SAMN02787118_12336 [Streptomyces mirabilis]|uniref:Uncharacterized protein n=1 Tax=Streptomyces mirabilis TaxID=68239 RepID=A0A1I2T3B6_9ACTN|nr:hypothetical protein SAMN02787118_12336 [Streptomyces mirabilis]